MPPVAVTLMDVAEQVRVAVPELLVIPATGGAASWVMVMPAVAVQPLAAVAVTMYVPGAVNVLAAVDGVAPPLQE